MLVLPGWLIMIFMRTATRIFRVETEKVETEIVKSVVSVLQNEGVIAYPTDTFYGLGGDVFSEKAVNKIYTIKGRDFAKPLPAAVSDIDMVFVMAEGIPEEFAALVSRFWPGPLTVILKASGKVPRRMAGPGGTIGVRLPASSWVQAVIRRAGFPITATSANLSGEDNPNDPEGVRRDFWGKIDVLVDGGKTPGGKPSTVVDLTQPVPAILREGAVPASDIKKLLGTRS